MRLCAVVVSVWEQTAPEDDEEAYLCPLIRDAFSKRDRLAESETHSDPLLSQRH